MQIFFLRWKKGKKEFICTPDIHIKRTKLFSQEENTQPSLHIYIKEREEVFRGGSTKLVEARRRLFEVNRHGQVYTVMRDTSCVVKLDPIHPVHFKS